MFILVEPYTVHDHNIGHHKILLQDLIGPGHGVLALPRPRDQFSRDQFSRDQLPRNYGGRESSVTF